MSCRATIVVYTFKEGLLSPLGHDLRLRLRRFELRVARGLVEAELGLDSLIPEGAVRGRELLAGRLSSKDLDEITRTLHAKVLRTDRFPTATLEGRTSPASTASSAIRVSGTLTLAGKAHELAATVTPSGAELVAELSLQPSRWGIRPYRALGGTLKVQDRVTVRVELGLPGDPNELRDARAAAADGSLELTWTAG